MVKMSNIQAPCFAKSAGAGCRVLTTECEGIQGCPFYKPAECEDWMRVKRNGKEWLIPPEEYYEV